MAFTGKEGAQITVQQGATMTAAFRSKFPNEIKAHFFGKDIINTILAQNGCMGIRFYQGVDANGNLELVIVGADANENDLLNFIGDLASPCPSECDTNNSPLL